MATWNLEETPEKKNNSLHLSSSVCTESILMQGALRWDALIGEFKAILHLGAVEAQTVVDITSVLLKLKVTKVTMVLQCML